jgi:hypothetical protein
MSVEASLGRSWVFGRNCSSRPFSSRRRRLSPCCPAVCSSHRTRDEEGIGRWEVENRQKGRFLPRAAFAHGLLVCWLEAEPRMGHPARICMEDRGTHPTPRRDHLVGTQGPRCPRGLGAKAKESNITAGAPILLLKTPRVSLLATALRPKIVSQAVRAQNRYQADSSVDTSTTRLRSSHQWFTLGLSTLFGGKPRCSHLRAISPTYARVPLRSNPTLYLKVSAKLRPTRFRHCAFAQSRQIKVSQTWPGHRFHRV